MLNLIDYQMIVDVLFCVLSILGGCYLASQKVRAIFKRIPLSLEEKISLIEGLVLILSGFIALYVKSAMPVNALLLGGFLLPRMYQQEKHWKGHRLTSAYIMHCSGWILSIGAIVYGILLLL